MAARPLGTAGGAAAPFARTMIEAAVCLANEMVGGADRLREGARAGGFDIDAVTDADLTEPVLPPAPVTMDDLERVVSLISPLYLSVCTGPLLPN